MLYSAERKFVFIAVPKTGTTSIQNRLQELDDGVLRNQVHDESGALVKVSTHVSARDVRKIMGDRADDFTFVAFLRDPHDILVSKYNFYRHGRAARKQGLAEAVEGEPQKRSVGRFLRVLSAQLLPISVWARVYPYSSSAGYVTDANGALIVDQVGTVDRLQEDAERIFGPLGYPPEKLTLGTANQTIYDRARNPQIDAIVRRRCPQDQRLYDQAIAERQTDAPA